MNLNLVVGVTSADAGMLVRRWLQWIDQQYPGYAIDFGAVPSCDLASRHVQRYRRFVSSRSQLPQIEYEAQHEQVVNLGV